MTKAILQSYLTTTFGILAGLPVLVLGYFTPGTSMALPEPYQRILYILGGVGVIGLGIVAKAFNVHSTVNQVEASQATVENKPNAPALVKAADAQVENKPDTPPKP